MTKPLVNQPSALPTRKLTVAALVAPAATEAWQGVMSEVYPPLGGEAMGMLVGALSALAVGYFVKDRANT